MTDKTLIFAHRGIIGIENNSNKDSSNNEVEQAKIPASDIVISQEALDLLGTLSRSTADNPGYVYVGYDKETDAVVIQWNGPAGESVCIVPDLHPLEISSDLAAFVAAVTVVPENIPNPQFAAYVNSRLQYEVDMVDIIKQAGLEDRDTEDIMADMRSGYIGARGDAPADDADDTSTVVSRFDDADIEDELATAADNFSVIRDHNMTEEDTEQVAA